MQDISLCFIFAIFFSKTKHKKFKKHVTIKIAILILIFYNYNMFKSSKKKKESNIAHSPEQQEKNEELTKTKVFFLLWNVLSIALYSCYSFFVIYRLAEKSFLSKIIIYLLILYAVIFILLILINIGNRKKLKYKLKNYKSATKFLKYTIQILNFSLSIFTAISAFITTGKTDFSTIGFAILSIFVTVISIFFEFVKIIIRKNIPLIKHNFLEIREKPEKKKQDTE